jgi:hypothetical protein
MKFVLTYKRILFKIIGNFAREVKKATNFGVRKQVVIFAASPKCRSSAFLNGFELLHQKGSVAQLYRASDFGSEGRGLESLRGHKKKKRITKVFAFSFCPHSDSYRNTLTLALSFRAFSFSIECEFGVWDPCSGHQSSLPLWRACPDKFGRD